MTRAIVITGTDTGIGKTIFAAGLTKALGAHYWKPVQAGLEEATDTQIVQKLSGCQTINEAWRLKMPASPHLAAEAQGVEIDENLLTMPRNIDVPLVIEGAGGLMVPLNRKSTYLDVFARWQQPIILCARTQLGTINHTLLSIKALRDARCDIAGVAFIGAPEPEVEQTICDFGTVKHLGRLPILAELTPDGLADAFKTHIDVAHIQKIINDSA